MNYYYIRRSIDGTGQYVGRDFETTLCEVDSAGVLKRWITTIAGCISGRVDRRGQEHAEDESMLRVLTTDHDTLVTNSQAITKEEFERAWTHGLFPETPFSYFKRDLLAEAGSAAIALFEAWLHADNEYPYRPLSERLSVAERAIRELLVEGLIMLVWRDDDPQNSRIYPSEWDAVLRSRSTWMVDEGVRVWFLMTDKGVSVGSVRGTLLR